MPKVIVVGGGWAGCGAALAARKAGAEVVILEKTDMLLGCGLVGGIMRNNGRYTAAEEAIALGAGELFEIADETARHRNVDFPGHSHATLYDVLKIEPRVRKFLEKMGVELRFQSRAVDVKMEGKRIKSIVLADGETIEGDVYVETTGSSGPMGNCVKYGNGCCMCIQRCPAFGPRVSISKKAGVEDLVAKRSPDLYGAMSGSCKLNKDSLGEDIKKELEKKGVVVIKLPDVFIHKEKLSIKVCQQYALDEYAENIVLLDTGHAKLMAPFFSLDELRKIKGFENVRFEDPYAGSKGNSIRYMSMAPRDDYLQVEGVENLFCAGEKSGPIVGHTEAICTGILAGHNAVRKVLKMELLKLPRELAIGDMIAYVNEELKKPEGLYKRFTFAGSTYFERMKKFGLYLTEKEAIRKKVKNLQLYNVFNENLVTNEGKRQHGV
ncbi:tRNA uridine 5-carboxymethylaminomethyl modification enzyme MnmG [Fervidicola ferrireducens]|uniref:tRNA uridine 5-carboxymethylaminomethyl modification enzyme MnmG n=1 Tax=Fervidicola ferrireducens TaxID=520764 RepID=A0A140L425_9FIRM|nr:FAD-dependent oxidoreductase [Fervidicola ferrireducens]KXG75300.1 tRNA uridine 5-carboxymethylaminomethyl modification enzyme MnmG [Fervidicola ferrireducens]